MGRQRTQCGLRRVGDDTRVGSGPSTSDRQRGQHICWQLGIIRLHDFVECRQALGDFESGIGMVLGELDL